MATSGMSPLASPTGPGGQNLARRGVTGASFQTDFTQMGAQSRSIFGGGGANILDEERRLIDKVFSIVDKDQSGSIDWKELEEMFKLFGVETHFLRTAIERIMSNVDQDHDGMISPTEFYKLLSQKFEPGDPRNEMRTVFDRMDEKNDSVLDVDELHKVAVMLGEVDMDKDEVRKMIGNFIELHAKKAQDTRPGQAPPKNTGDFHGRITEKEKDTYVIKSETLKNMKDNPQLQGKIKGGEVPLQNKDVMKHFKVGDTVKFRLNQHGGNIVASQLEEPQLSINEFYTVMEEEL